jgi:alpha-tubulin suppressor-like RCC1 family protein
MSRTRPLTWMAAAVICVGCGFDGPVLAPASGGVGSFGMAAGVFAGQELTCALAGGRARCFGANVDGALGSGDRATHLTPVPVAAAVGFDGLAAGENHVCGLEHGSGAVWCWGYNASGQLGLGDTASRDAPARLPQPAAAIALAAGYNHVCAIAADHTLWCWGDNTEGQLGQADLPGAPNALSPVRVGGDSDWIGVAGGQGHTCGVRAPSTMWCWGRNNQPELGAAPTVQQSRTPTQTGTFTDWTPAIDVGQDSSCGIRGDGTLWCWGDNTFGQLGAPPEGSPVAAPRQLGSQAEWVTISLDAFSACGVRSDGGLWCWGRNAEGQLGTGDNVDRYVPTVVGSSGWAGASVGRFHACAIRTSGDIACMGENSNGQLGLGDTARRDVPTGLALPAL